MAFKDQGKKLVGYTKYEQKCISNYFKKNEGNENIKKYERDYVKDRQIRLPDEIWEDIFAKYRTGQYTAYELAKMYGVSKELVYMTIRDKGVKVDEDAVEAIKEFESGFNRISNILHSARDNEDVRAIKKMADELVGMNNEDREKAILEAEEDLMNEAHNKLVPFGKGNAKKKAKSDVITAEIIDNKTNVKLANEIIEIVSRKNPAFARGFQALSALILKRAEEVLNNEKGASSNDIKNIANALKDLDQTMSIFPKQPTVAQQFNFGKSEKEKVDTDINLNVKIIDGKSEKE